MLSVLLLTDEPGVEKDSIEAAVKLVYTLAGDDCDLCVASPCPSAWWVESLRSLGARVFVLKARRDTRNFEFPGEMSEIICDVCPHLKTRREQGITLSVCGKHKGRMVVTGKMLDLWCLRNAPECPHRRIVIEDG